MAWVENAKRGGPRNGGPQYYLQGLSPAVKAVVDHRRSFPIQLWTPYGMVETQLKAVSKSKGKVKHYRILIADRSHKTKQIAAQVAYWYKLKRSDLERIDFEDEMNQNALLVWPTGPLIFCGGTKSKLAANRQHYPLTVTKNIKSSLLVEHFKRRLKDFQPCRKWLIGQIAGLVDQYATHSAYVDERDLLRASGALDWFGVSLGMYRNKGVDCMDAVFQLGDYPRYQCPVEIEKCSSSFHEKHHGPHRKQRIVVLCMEHDKQAVLCDHVDVIELRALSDLLKGLA